MTFPVMPLEEVATIVGGGTPPRDVPEYFGGDICWATPTDVTRLDTLHIDDTKETISEVGLRNSSAKLLPPRSVLLTSRATIGFVAVTSRPMATNQGFINFICKPCITPEYLARWLLTQKERLLQLAGGTTFKEVSKGNVRKLTIPVPSLSEQQRIVDILDRAASIQRLRKAADDKLKEIIPALFVDMFGDPATNPKGLLVSCIGDVCNLVRGSSPRPQGDKRYFGGPVPRLMIADITRDGVYVTPRIDSLTELGATKSRPMRKGSVVMAVSGAVGLPAILDIDACIHDGFVGFRDLRQDIQSEYLYWYIRSQKAVAASQAVGATFQNLTTDQIKQWSIPLPPLDKQAEFVSRVAELNSNHRLAATASASSVELMSALNYQFFG